MEADANDEHGENEDDAQPKYCIQSAVEFSLIVAPGDGKLGSLGKNLLTLLRLNLL